MKGKKINRTRHSELVGCIRSLARVHLLLLQPSLESRHLLNNATCVSAGDKEKSKALIYSQFSRHCENVTFVNARESGLKAEGRKKTLHAKFTYIVITLVAGFSAS